MTAQPDIGDIVVTNLAELLAVTGCSDLSAVADQFADGLDSDVTAVEDDWGGIEFELVEFGSGITETFPFTLAEVWSDLNDLEAEHWTPILLEAMSEEVATVEGFDVVIELDERFGDEALLELIGRRTTMNGIVVQYDRSFRYPFRTQMSGTTTVDMWLRKRFFRRCPGFGVAVRGDLSTTLRELRGGNQAVEFQEFGIELLEQRQRSDNRQPRRHAH